MSSGERRGDLCTTGVVIHRGYVELTAAIHMQYRSRVFGNQVYKFYS